MAAAAGSVEVQYDADPAEEEFFGAHPMQPSHATHPMSTEESASDKLMSFVAQRRTDREPIGDFETFENELRQLFAAAECEVLGQELSCYDINVPMFIIDGEPHRRVLRETKTYLGAVGPVVVPRSLYRRRQGERAFCPMELQAGVVKNYWTPRAAKLGLWTVAQLTPKEAEEFSERVGAITPSMSSLDRLPKRVGTEWEANRKTFEASLRAVETVPTAAVTMSASLDGVFVPIKEGNRTVKRAQQQAKGKQTKGPSGYKEASCATVSFYDQEGRRLMTRRFVRMPESKKVTLKQMLPDEVLSALEQSPDLRLVKVADGAKNNWTFLMDSLPHGPAVVDFYYATEHLNAALVADYGETNPKLRSQYDKLRAMLLEDPQGAEKVIRALVYPRVRFPRRKKLAKDIGFFRRKRHKMNYATFKALNFPIGSGVIEAVCKTLLTQRMKRSGMGWSPDGGGQALLTRCPKVIGLIEGKTLSRRLIVATCRFPTTSFR